MFGLIRLKYVRLGYVMLGYVKLCLASLETAFGSYRYATHNFFLGNGIAVMNLITFFSIFYS